MWRTCKCNEQGYYFDPDMLLVYTHLLPYGRLWCFPPPLKTFVISDLSEHCLYLHISPARFTNAAKRLPRPFARQQINHRLSESHCCPRGGKSPSVTPGSMVLTYLSSRLAECASTVLTNWHLILLVS